MSGVTICLLSLVAIFSGTCMASEDTYHFVSLDGASDRYLVESPLVRNRRDVATNDSMDTASSSTAPPAPSTPRGSTTTTPIPPTTQNPYGNITVYRDSHVYYESTIILDKNVAKNYMRAFREAYSLNYKSHQILSNAHRIALQVKISFDFLFYGHIVNKVTIATGGFLYMSHYLHRYLTHSQYIAPLMADFDTGKGAGDVLYADTGSAFYVQWQNVHLKYQHEIGTYTFEAILHKNGTIVFAYEAIPAELSKISVASHVVKVGIADAYYKDEDHPTDKNYFTRRILPYDTVDIKKEFITSETVIILHPYETCVQQPTCSACVNSKTTFDCAWCTAVDRCSSGTDRMKQEWNNMNCHQVNTKSDCPTTAQEAGIIVLIVFIVIILVAALGAFGYWLYYSYTHPATPSGIWLMEHRPSVLAAKFTAWRRGGNTDASDIYRVDSTSTA